MVRVEELRVGIGSGADSSAGEVTLTVTVETIVARPPITAFAMLWFKRRARFLSIAPAPTATGDSHFLKREAFSLSSRKSQYKMRQTIYVYHNNPPDEDERAFNILITSFCPIYDKV